MKNSVRIGRYILRKKGRRSLPSEHDIRAAAVHQQSLLHCFHQHPLESNL